MSGPLCDAALGTTGSLALLRRLERHNLFVVALDSHRSAYRYHRLFRDLLRDELDERDPGAAPRSTGSRPPGAPATTSRSKRSSMRKRPANTDLVARLVARYTFPLHWSGRTATLGRWLNWFDRDGERDRRARS